MKKWTLATLLLFIILTSKAQRATVENDIAKYKGKSYKAGDTITLGYGSTASKDFVYIQLGSVISGLNGLIDLDRDWANQEAVIEKITVRGQAVYLRAKPIGKKAPEAGGKKLYIGLEASIDKKELRE